MQLNLPILDQLADSQHILIAGAGGGFDIFCGLPLYFTLKALGKDVHLANYSFTTLELIQAVCTPYALVEGLVHAPQGEIGYELIYYPEGYLVQWFKKVRGEDVTVWMMARTGAAPLAEGYAALVKHLNIDAIVLVDGGVDSIMRGDEAGPGTLVEDSISLAAVEPLDVPVKILTCIGFGTEVEESLCHYNALENIAALAKAGGFLGSCALTPQMEVFQRFEEACRYVWEQPKHAKSHISTRIIPAARGEFGSYKMYPEEYDYSGVFISPLMSLYWFFDARKVTERSLLIPRIRDTMTTTEAIVRCSNLMSGLKLRARKSIPY
jgi:hypothetical protein